MLKLPSPRSSLILLGLALLAGAATAGAGSQETVATGEVAEPSGGEPNAPSTSTASIAIADRAFAPLDALVVAGDTVEWTDADGEGHTVSATWGAFDSGVVPRGATFSQVFETPGSYDYLCAIHPEMRGTVTVAERGATAAASAIPTAASTAPITEVPISIVDTVYDPARVEVLAGSTVRWTNEDAVIHTVTARDGRYSSGVMKTGDEFSLTFDKPGTYDYFCAIHPLQSGQVVVTDPGA